MRYEYEIDPFAAVRSNRNSWNERTVNYHAKMNKLREAIGEDKEKIIEMMIEGCSVTFQIKIPESWSKKKKEEHQGKPHRSRLDLDNLEKALKDTLFYKHEHNDCEISSTQSHKIWGPIGKITIEPWKK